MEITYRWRWWKTLEWDCAWKGNQEDLVMRWLMKKETGKRGGKWRLVCQKQWSPGEPKTTGQRNSKANYTKNKKTNVISGRAKTYTEGRHPQSWRCKNKWWRQDRGKQWEDWIKTDTVAYVMKEMKPLNVCCWMQGLGKQRVLVKA